MRAVRLEPAPLSPARAANHGLELADGDRVGLLIDGARLASPGLLATARLAACLAARPVITAPAWHLGPVTHMQPPDVAHDQAAEDGLLAQSGWETDGYRLFAISTFAGSSGRGMFAPVGESSSLFLPRDIWNELGGLDERFSLPHGCLVNHDLFRRACELDAIEIVVMLGEGTFHQFHGGASTSRRQSWDELHAEYEAIRGYSYRAPQNWPLDVGRLSESALDHVERSVTLAHE